MFNNSIKSTTLKAGRTAALQTTRTATAARALLANRGLPAGARTQSPAAQQTVSPADRVGAAVTVALSLALVAGGSLMVAQIWTHLAMIR
jgi:hypothetical protein